MLNKIQSLNADFDESDELTKFIAYLNGYNKGHGQDKKNFIDFEEQLVDYFEYRWKNNHN